MLKLSPVILCLVSLMTLGMPATGRPAASPAARLWGKSPPENSQSPPAPASIDAQIEALRENIAVLENETAPENLDPTAKLSTATASQEEITERRILLQQLTRLYLHNIDSLTKLRALQQSRVRLEQQTTRSAGLTEPPPYSFLKVDELRESVRSLKLRMQPLNVLTVDFQQEIERRTDQLKEAGEKLRQAAERLETRAADADTSRLTWLRDLAELRLRQLEARIGVIQTEQALVQGESAEIRLQLDLAEKKLREASRQLVFPELDREWVRRQLDAERRRLQTEFDEVSAELLSRRKQLGSAPELPALGQGADLSRLSEQEFTLTLQHEQMENADVRFTVLNRLLDGVKARQGVWELRWSMADTRDTEKLRLAYARIDKTLKELNPLKDYVEQRMRLTSHLMSELENRLRSSGSPGSSNRYQQLTDLYYQRESSYRRMLAGIESIEQLLEFWKQDLDDRRLGEPLSVHFQEWLAQTRDAGVALWQFELFAVQDTIEVDGKTITGKRSVTVGKVLTALLILVIGLWIAAKLSHGMARIAVSRVGMDASHARIARRWVLFLLGLILVVSSLEMVKIPLTVFAFMGGVVAIGSGFAMQNMLKNLISGLMLLVERPFRPGDLVEVGGIRGRVIDIGMRSSNIRDGNGIETVIPNSTFVEQNVTNWTLSSRSVRIVVKIGVVYGSPLQQVSDLLLEVAGRHGLVQADPAPQVLFEDFGSDALIFGLYVWVELKLDVDWRTVTSDLRYMIDKAMAAQGIVLAFPQRDVHLDVSRPLEVRVHALDHGAEN